MLVVGLGAHGSSSAAHLVAQKGGVRVVGIDQFQPGHCLGSSHGKSRIIRMAYFEGPEYVPLLRRSFELWRQLQTQMQRELLVMTGCLLIGRPDSEVITGSLASVKQHSLVHSILSAEEIHARFPYFTPSSSEMGIYESEAGYLIPEACIEAYQALAIANGADLRFGETLLGWEAQADGRVAVRTSRSTYLARKLVLAVGAWAPLVYGAQIPGVPLTILRNILYWFEAADPGIGLSMRSSPVYFWDNGEDAFYGFPETDDGIKVAFHRTNATEADRACSALNVDRSVGADEEALMRRVLRGRLNGIGPCRASSACMYTSTESHHLYATHTSSYF